MKAVNKHNIRSYNIPTSAPSPNHTLTPCYRIRQSIPYTQIPFIQFQITKQHVTLELFLIEKRKKRKRIKQMKIIKNQRELTNLVRIAIQRQSVKVN